MSGEHPRDTLRRLEQQARKRFGQNFLVSEHATKRIVRLAGAGEGTRVLEIGPGLGALSRALLDTGAQVRAVELDRDMAAHLRSDLPDLDLVEGDALQVDLDEVAPGTGWVCCANLPYNVSTRILRRLLPDRRFDRLVLMFQKEVAQRLVAGPGSKTYGSLSVLVAAHAKARLAFTLGPGDFHPRPKIDSAVVVFDLVDSTVEDLEFFEKVVRAGFSQRRKVLENAMGSVFGKERVSPVLEATVGGRRRAESLSLAEWIRLAEALA